MEGGLVRVLILGTGRAGRRHVKSILGLCPEVEFMLVRD